MTREEFVARCMYHKKNYYKEGYYKSKAWEEDFELTDSEEYLFKCPHCGDKMTFFDLDVWTFDVTVQDILDETILCPSCYELALNGEIQVSFFVKGQPFTAPRAFGKMHNYLLKFQ